jgi:hypothetical protein
MLEPYSHTKCTNLRKLAFNTMYTSKILFEETKQNRKPLLSMPKTYERGTSHSRQLTPSAMQNKSTSIRQKVRHVGIHSSSISCLLCPSPTAIEVRLQKASDIPKYVHCKFSYTCIHMPFFEWSPFFLSLHECKANVCWNWIFGWKSQG